MNRQIGWVLISLFVLQLLGGLINVLLLTRVDADGTPDFVRNSVWICLVLFAAEAMASEEIADDVDPGREPSNQSELGEA